MAWSSDAKELNHKVVSFMTHIKTLADQIYPLFIS